MDKLDFLNNLNKLHTTELGLNRIRKNLRTDESLEDILSKIPFNQANIYKKGKNYYVEHGDIVLTINSYNYCIITMKILKNKDVLSGLLIKESLNNDDILDFIKIKKVEIWKTNNNPKYWTAISFITDDFSFPEKLSKSLKENDVPWYVDLKCDNEKIIVLKNNVLSYEIGNHEQRDLVIKRCKELGVPDEMLDWCE